MKQLAFDDRGLVPAVVQHHANGRVLMLAWMNADAVEATRDTGFAHFWSRSRQALWKKGETSGNTLAVVDVRYDCDADAVLIFADPAGPTCHTGTTSCFFRAETGDDDGPPGSVLDRLWAILQQRKSAGDGRNSYVAALLAAGPAKISAKIAEEQGELCAELPAGDDDAIVYEAADLLFHMMVGLLARDVDIDRVLSELARRFGTSGHDEKASRSK